MTSENVGPCPECREPVDLDARVCPHCRRSVLVDVGLEGSLKDGRSRYRTARALLALGEGVPTLTVLQSALTSGQGTVAYGVSRAVGERAAEIVRGAGGQAAIRKVGEYVEETAGGYPRRLSVVGLVLAAVACLAAIAIFFTRGQDSPSVEPRVAEAPAAEMSPEEVAALGLPATVALECGEQSGSGFFVAEDLLLTNAHVLCHDTSSVTVRFSDGRETEGTIEDVDESLDLAVVRASGLRAEPLLLGDAGALNLGQRLTMIGSPLGLEFSVHECGVSNLDRHDLGLALMQIDAAVNAGNSGGPLLDRRGRVVGVVTLKMAAGEGIALAVPINYAFTGPEALLDGYADRATSGFARMRARAQSASDQEAEELQATGQRPGLVAAVVRGPVMVAQIVWPSSAPPFERDFAFALVKGDERLCSMTGEVSEWTKLESEGDRGVLPARVAAWLERHGFGTELYQAVAVMQWDHCPADQLGGIVDLEMEEADDDARRVRFGR